MNNKEKLYLTKVALNEKQRSFLGGFPSKALPTDSRYRESVAEDNKRSEQMAAKHRRMSQAAKVRQPSTAKKLPVGPAQGAMAGVPKTPSAPAPWHAGYKNPDAAKIQQGQAQSNQMMSNSDKQVNQSLNRNSLGVPSPSKKSPLAFNVNGAGNFSPSK